MRAATQPMKVQPKKRLMRKIHQKFWAWREPAINTGRKWIKNPTTQIRMMTRMGKPRRKLMG
jgi:tryptophan synthase beta subunit